MRRTSQQPSARLPILNARTPPGCPRGLVRTKLRIQPSHRRGCRCHLVTPTLWRAKHMQGEYSALAAFGHHATSPGAAKYSAGQPPQQRLYARLFWNAGDLGRPVAASVVCTAVPWTRTRDTWRRRSSATSSCKFRPGKANPSPPVGPALGQRGLNIMAFVQGIQRPHADHGAGHAGPRGDHRVRRPHLHLHHQDAAEHLLPEEGGGHHQGQPDRRQGRLRRPRDHDASCARSPRSR